MLDDDLKRLLTELNLGQYVDELESMCCEQVQKTGVEPQIQKIESEKHEVPHFTPHIQTCELNKTKDNLSKISSPREHSEKKRVYSPYGIITLCLCFGTMLGALCVTGFSNLGFSNSSTNIQRELSKVPDTGYVADASIKNPTTNPAPTVVLKGANTSTTTDEQNALSDTRVDLKAIPEQSDATVMPESSDIPSTEDIIETVHPQDTETHNGSAYPMSNKIVHGENDQKEEVDSKQEPMCSRSCTDITCIAEDTSTENNMAILVYAESNVEKQNVIGHKEDNASSAQVMLYMQPIADLVQKRREVLHEINQRINQLLDANASTKQELFDEECSLLLSRYQAEDLRYSYEIAKQIKLAMIAIEALDAPELASNFGKILIENGYGSYTSYQVDELKAVLQSQGAYEGLVSQIQTSLTLDKLTAYADQARALLDSTRQNAVLAVFFDVNAKDIQLQDAIVARLQSLFFDPQNHLPITEFTTENKRNLQHLVSAHNLSSEISKQLHDQFELLQAVAASTQVNSSACIVSFEGDTTSTLPTEEQTELVYSKLIPWYSLISFEKTKSQAVSNVIPPPLQIQYIPIAPLYMEE